MSKPRELVERPQPARKRNPGMRAHGYEPMPTGPMVHVDRGHLRRQETFGMLFFLCVAFAVAYVMFR